MRWTCEVRARVRPAGVLVMVITTTMDWTPGTASTVPDSYAFGKYVVHKSDPFGNLGHRSVTMIQNPNVHVRMD